MSFEVFLREYRGLLALLSVLATVNVMFAHRAGRGVAPAAPLGRAGGGTRRIDWWPRCVLGVGRLGFTAAGHGLALRTRVQFQAVAVTYVVLVALFAKAMVDIVGLVVR